MGVSRGIISIHFFPLRPVWKWIWRWANSFWAKLLRASLRRLESVATCRRGEHRHTWVRVRPLNCQCSISTWSKHTWAPRSPFLLRLLVSQCQLGSGFTHCIQAWVRIRCCISRKWKNADVKHRVVDWSSPGQGVLTAGSFGPFCSSGRFWLFSGRLLLKKYEVICVWTVDHPGVQIYAGISYEFPALNVVEIWQLHVGWMDRKMHIIRFTERALWCCRRGENKGRGGWWTDLSSWTMLRS